MSKESNGAPDGDQRKKINLRRPDIMEAVQAQVLSHYRSELVENTRANGGVLSADGLTVKLAKEFGFCYGVERAIDLAYAARKYFSEHAPHTPIYLLGEIIHNPEVNDQIQNMGIQIISAKPTEDEVERLQSGDAVIIPAFGTEVSTRKKLEAKGCRRGDPPAGPAIADLYLSLGEGEAFFKVYQELDLSEMHGEGATFRDETPLCGKLAQKAL